MKVIDSRDIEGTDVVDADICIIGSGPSGFTLAKRLSGMHKRVVVLESGDAQFSHKAQSLSRGDIVGIPYEPLHICRVRRLGGSTGRPGWGGWCKTLCPEDFERRSFIPDSGWPFGFKEMLPHYRRAFETCGFENLDSERLFEKPDPKTDSVSIENAFLAPTKDFADAWAALRDADPPNLTVLYHATVTEILTGNSAEAVDAVEFSNGRQTFRLRAGLVVVATGGIENARLLLLSDSTHANGLGNSHDLVGRYFMEHPRFRWGNITSNGTGGDIFLLDPSHINRSGKEFPADLEIRLARGLVLPPAVREREGLLSSRTWLQPLPEGGEGDGARSLREMGFWIAKGRRPPHLRNSLSRIARHPVDTAQALLFYKGPASRRMGAAHFGFNSIFEQAPDRDSRVTLSRSRDSHGCRKATLDWRINDLTWHTIRRTQELLAEHMTALGHAVNYDAWTMETPARPRASWVRHHMGTTRMSESPSSGVVDRDCRVHGMKNLYIAGTSVLPTGGNDMITLTAVALAHRLADKLEKEVAAH